MEFILNTSMLCRLDVTKLGRVCSAPLPVLVCCAAMLCASCKVGPDYRTPPAKVASQWAQELVATNSPPAASEVFWWRCLNDPVLNELVTAAQRNNLSLQAAGVRVLEARAQLNKSIGNLFPQQQGISAGIDYSRSITGRVRLRE